MNYDTGQDAHKHSNHRQANVIREVIVDLSVVGVTEQTVAQLFVALKKSKDFILFNDEGFAAFCPKHLCCYMQTGGNTIIYTDLKQMINAIKLIMLTYTEIHITDFQIDNHANIHKKIQPKLLLAKR
jgi:hypothetical protein